jgi:DNA adenine methylase
MLTWANCMAQRMFFHQIAKYNREEAFRRMLKDITYNGGILAEGAGLIKNGENGKGLRSRWYPSTLKRRIADIAAIENRLEFIEGDGLRVIEANSARKDVAFFIDPPYTQAGRRLYKYHQIDHKRLFDLVKRVSGDFIITYDAASEIEEMASQRELEVERVVMKTTHHLKKCELVIGRNLGWLREMLEG